MSNKTRRRRTKRSRAKARLVPQDLVNYFAYGSNLLACRLRARIGYAKLVGIGQLHGYRLTFNFLVANSGKCDIYETGNPEDVVWGAIFAIPRALVPRLDQFEGVPYFVYERKFVTIDMPDGPKEAITYIGVNGERWRKDWAKPFDWYKHHVVLGANQLGLPVEYQEFLAGWRTCTDPLDKRFLWETQFWQ